MEQTKGKRGGFRPGSGRKKGSKGKRKFPEAVERRAERVMTELLASDNEKIKVEASRFILEQNRGKAKQQIDLAGEQIFTVEIIDATKI